MTKFVSIIDRGIASVLQGLEEEGIDKDTWDDVSCLSLHANALLSLEGVQGLTSLIELNVSSNMLSSDSLSSSGWCLSGLVHLKSLDMSTNNLENLKSIPLLPSLARLVIAHNKIKDIRGLERIAGCSLEYLDVHDNCLSEPLSVHVQSLQGILSLKELMWSPNPCDISERLPSVAVLLCSRTLPCLEALDGTRMEDLDSAIHNATAPTTTINPASLPISNHPPNPGDDRTLDNMLCSYSLDAPAMSPTEVDLPRYTAVAKRHLKLLHERLRLNSETTHNKEVNTPHINPKDSDEGVCLASLEGLAADIRVEVLERRLETLEGNNLAPFGSATPPQAVQGQLHPKQCTKEKKALARKRRVTPPDLRSGGSSSSPHGVVGIKTALPYSNFMMDAATQAGPRVRDTAIQTTTQEMLDAEIQVDSGIEEDEALCHFLSLNLAVKRISLVVITKIMSWGFFRWKNYTVAAAVSEKVSSGCKEAVLRALDKEVPPNLHVPSLACFPPATQKVVTESIERVVDTVNSVIGEARSYSSTLESRLTEKVRCCLELKEACARESQETTVTRSRLECTNETLRASELEVAALKEELNKAHDDIKKMDATMKLELLLAKKQLCQADEQHRAQEVIHKALQEESRNSKEKLKEEQVSKQMALHSTEIELHRQVAKAVSAAEEKILKCHSNAKAKVEAFRSTFHQLVAIIHELKNELHRVSSEAESAKKSEALHKKESQLHQGEVYKLLAKIGIMEGREDIAGKKPWEGMDASGQCSRDTGTNNGLEARECTELLLDEAYQDLRNSEKARKKLEAEVKSRDEVLQYIEEEMKDLREARHVEIESLNKALREAKCAQEVNSYAKQVADDKLKIVEEDLKLQREELSSQNTTKASLTEELKLITSDLEATRADLKAVKLELQASEENKMTWKDEARRYMGYMQNMECKMKELICAVDGERAIARQKAKVAMLASEKLAAFAAETSSVLAMD